MLSIIELWRDVSNFEGYYQVSNFGRVRGLPRTDRLGRRINPKVLTLQRDKDGYSVVNLTKNENVKAVKVHRLVAIAFLSNECGLPEVNHIDGNKSNNRADNLEWCTHKSNHVHARKTGLICQTGESSVNHKLTYEEVKFIRTNCVKGDPKFGVTALARLFGVSAPTVSRIVNGIRWKE